MKKMVDIKRFKFYLWIGVISLCLRLLSELAKNRDLFFARAFNDTWRIAYVVVVNYFLFEHALPRLSRKRFFSSLLRVLFFIFLYSAGLYIWRSLAIEMHLTTAAITFPPSSSTISDQMAYSVTSIFLVAIIRHIYLYIRLKRTAQQLQIEKQQAELNYLKSQTNPHFLFNTLNNIYSLSRDKSDLAPESILRLSKILRYMLYETSGPYIAIEC